MAAIAPSCDFFNYYYVLAVAMLILCGVFYPVDILPVVMQGALRCCP
ncbi:MAG: hypothetical protein WBG92_12650 [Thiohalocapsa sp.]